MRAGDIYKKAGETLTTEARMNLSEGQFGEQSVPLPMLENSGGCDRNRITTRKCLTESSGRDNPDIDGKKGQKKGTIKITPLPRDFIPGDRDVICGRGRSIWQSPGNTNFRKILVGRVDEYSTVATKAEKSNILSAIVDEVRKESPYGGFVKRDAITGQWSEVGDFLAREKVSQGFRDMLHENYRSSNKTKRKRRLEEQEKSAEINAEMQKEAMEQLQSGRTDKNLYEIICQQQSKQETSSGKKKYMRLKDGIGRMDEVRRLSAGNVPPQSGLHEPSHEWNTAPSENNKYPDAERLNPIQYNQQRMALESPHLPRNDDRNEIVVSAKAVPNDGSDDGGPAHHNLQLTTLSDTQIPFESIPLAEDLANDIDNIFKL